MPRTDEEDKPLFALGSRTVKYTDSPENNGAIQVWQDDGAASSSLSSSTPLKATTVLDSNSPLFGSTSRKNEET